MKFSYQLLAVLALGALIWPRQAAAQEFTDCPDTENICVVEWASGTGEPIINALRNTIANDDPRPAGRVYVLKRGGYYYNFDRIANTGFHLRIVGQTAQEGAASGENVCGAGGNEDCGPAIIQRFRRDDGTVDGVMIETNGDGNSGFTLRNLWLMGQDNTGVTANYEPITVNASNSRFVIDNVIFDRNDWHHLGFKGGGNEIYVTNSSFRNLADATQIWGGRGIRLEAGADTVMFENNSFFNLTSFPFQSEAAPVEYFVFNHNTLVNFGRNFNAGGIWKEAYVANNLMVNPFWQGESEAQFQERLTTWLADGNDAADIDPYVGVFSIGTLPSQYGLETDRRIVLTNNNAWLSPDVSALYAPLNIRVQPLVSDSTMGFFNLYEGMVIEDNLSQNPQFVSAPTTSEVYGQMNSFLTSWINSAATPWAYVYWDPGRPAPGDELHPISISWPLPENFSYTNSALMTAGTDGLPLGDLNWFPQQKENYLANRADYLEALEDLGGAPPEAPAWIQPVQAEIAALDNAEIKSVEGFTSFFLESSGTITWQFDVPANGEYGLNVMTNMRNETERGQHIRVNGVGLQNSTNYGEYFFCSTASTNAECDFNLQPNTWETVQIRTADLIAEKATALTLTAGTHTLQIAPSWGYQGFSSVEVVDASGTVVATLAPPMATAAGVQEICESEGFCPSGFQWVDVQAGGSVTWTVNVPDGINSALFRLFYIAPSGGMGTLEVDGEERSTISFASTAADVPGEAVSTRFALATGSHQVKLTSTTGGLSLDNTIILGYLGEVTSNDRETLPEGYALYQSFPNPIRTAATIRYTLGAASPVTLSVFDLLGRRVATLVDGVQPAGTHDVQFDGSLLPSGTYFYRIETPVGQQVRKMVVVK